MGSGGMSVKVTSLLVCSWSVANVVIVQVDVYDWSAGVPWIRCCASLSDSRSSLSVLSALLSSFAILAVSTTWAILSALPLRVVLHLIALRWS